MNIDGDFVRLATPIKVEPQAQNSIPASPCEIPTLPIVQTAQEARVLTAHPLPFSPTPSSRDIPATHPSSSQQPQRLQRKRKRSIDAGDEEEMKPSVCKRSRKARLETLSEGRREDAREGRQNGHEQAPAEPQPRRSTRIQAKKDAAPPKVENPAKSTSRKSAARKR